MYKIVFVVAVFAFALQGAFSSPVADNESPTLQANSKTIGSNAETQVKTRNNTNEASETTVTASTEASTTTSAPKSGASSTEMCLLLVQVSSLALVAKHMLL